MNICQNYQLTKQQRLFQILDLLKKEGFYYTNGKLYLSENNSAYQQLNYTTSIIKISSDKKMVDKTCQFVLELVEHENTIKKIIHCINSIVLEEDRYIFRLSIQEVMKKHFVSQKTFYKAIENSTLHLYQMLLIK